MAVSTVAYAYRLLNAFQLYNQISPWSFNQIVGQGVDAELSSTGQGIFVRPEIEQVAQVIRHAQAQALGYMGTYHRPEYCIERIPLDTWQGAGWRNFRTRYHYVKAIGKRGTTLIEAGAAVVYSDSDSDGIDDLATITVNTTVTDPTELQVFFRVASGAQSAADRRWQIEPLDVSITAGVATITGHRSLFVQPSLWAKPYRPPNYNSSSKNYGSTTANGDFVTTVDVYRVYPDPVGAVSLVRHTPCLTCPEDTLDTGCASVTNGRLGLIDIGVSQELCRRRVYYAIEIHYLAGYPLDEYTGRPDTALEGALIKLANATFPRLPPNMKEVTSGVWMNDAAPYPADAGLKNFEECPFGSRIGHIEAWQIMKQPEYQIAEADAMTTSRGFRFW